MFDITLGLLVYLLLHSSTTAILYLFDAQLQYKSSNKGDFQLWKLEMELLADEIN
jgi:hypothetical protein